MKNFHWFSLVSDSPAAFVSLLMVLRISSTWSSVNPWVFSGMMARLLGGVWGGGS